MKYLMIGASAIALMAGSVSAQDIVIHTGGGTGSSGEGSTYHNGMGKAVEEVLSNIAGDMGYNDATRIPSGGAVDNANQCAADTTNMCFGIGQGGLTYAAVERGDVIVVRNDLPGECAMIFTAENALPNWRSVAENANRVQWVVGENSGSRAFIEKVYSEDSAFAGQSPNFLFVEGSEAQLAEVQSGRGKVGFFYAFPNPTSGTINAAYKADLDIFGVLSPDVAKGSSDFYLERQAPYALAWLGLGETKTTRAMCSSALLFMANPERIEDPWTKGDAVKLLAAVRAAPASDFTPNGGPLAKLMQNVAEMSEKVGVAEMVSDLEDQVAEQLN